MSERMTISRIRQKAFTRSGTTRHLDLPKLGRFIERNFTGAKVSVSYTVTKTLPYYDRIGGELVKGELISVKWEGTEYVYSTANGLGPGRAITDLCTWVAKNWKRRGSPIDPQGAEESESEGGPEQTSFAIQSRLRQIEEAERSFGRLARSAKRRVGNSDTDFHRAGVNLAS